MTGGRVVILGPSGRNFAAGMSGGIAYVLDEQGDFPRRCNPQMVVLEKLDNPDEIEQVWKMIQRHQTYTHSARAKAILSEWDRHIPQFVKVMPKDYKRVLQSLERVQASGLTGEEAIMAAFEENARDVARIGGG
jgi:glutamate synthase (ferredoxin)